MPTGSARAAFLPVFPLRRAALVLCGLMLLHLPARAAVLIHEFALRGSLSDNLDGDPLTALGGQITSLGYVFAANQGISLSSRILDPQSYSVELSFRLDNISGPTKIIDFHNLTSDPGLYQRNGRLDFTPVTTAATTDFSAGLNVHLVLTRNGETGLVTAYVNGQERFSFLDPNGLASTPGFSNKLNFFVEDNGLNASGGTLNYLRVFNGSLNANEVSGLYAAGPPNSIPEPSTVALLGAGLVTLLCVGKRRKRRN